ncbi:MAG: Signal transduction histidine kinase [Candidatus Lokiarchaeum sp. GC14_75]|nr:MAG: Signal transduction histidine kinase [Candidatus Lokiarchaeum sp. GC14_75]
MFYFLFRILLRNILTIWCTLNLTTEEKKNIDIDDLDVNDIFVPDKLILKWQKIVNLLAELINVPAALIMKLNPPYIEVFRSSETIDNPYKVGEKEYFDNSGLYCEHVIKTRNKLLVSDALKDENWNKNPDIKLGMISYLGFPLFWPDGVPFGTICVLDLKENTYSESQRELLFEFKEVLEIQLNLLYENCKRDKIINKYQKSQEKLRISEGNLQKSYEQAVFYRDLFTHDIGNIFSNLKLSQELISIYQENKDENIKINDILSIIQNSIERGTKLIHNVQKLSQLENSDIKLQPMDLCMILNNSISFLHESYPKKEIEVKIQSPSHKRTLVVSNELLLDVFENILINAVKYNDNPIVKILIKISKKIEDNVLFIKIEFIDNGIGIIAARKGLIFTKQFKKDSLVKGMGIGLSLVKKIVNSFKGRIWVEDRVTGEHSKGSNFILMVPEEI